MRLLDGDALDPTLLDRLWFLWDYLPRPDGSLAYARYGFVIEEVPRTDLVWLALVHRRRFTPEESPPHAP